MICYGEEATELAHAYAIGGRRQTEAVNQNTGLGDASKIMLPQFPGEAAPKAAKQRWCREARRRLPAELQTVLGGRVPAKLKADTETFDVTTLPALPEAATEATRSSRDALVAKYTHENAKCESLRQERMRELRNEVAGHIGDCMEYTAGLKWKTLAAAHAVEGHPA